MGMVFVDLVAGALAKNANQGFNVTGVGVGPDVVGIFRRDCLQRDEM